MCKRCPSYNANDLLPFFLRDAGAIDVGDDSFKIFFDPRRVVVGKAELVGDHFGVLFCLAYLNLIQPFNNPYSPEPRVLPPL